MINLEHLSWKIVFWLLHQDLIVLRIYYIRNDWTNLVCFHEFITSKRIDRIVRWSKFIERLEILFYEMNAVCLFDFTTSASFEHFLFVFAILLHQELWTEKKDSKKFFYEMIVLLIFMILLHQNVDLIRSEANLVLIRDQNEQNKMTLL